MVVVYLVKMLVLLLFDVLGDDLVEIGFGFIVGDVSMVVDVLVILVCWKIEVLDLVKVVFDVVSGVLCLDYE